MSADPGWYPDPGGQPGYRYWDGHRWTDATQATPRSTSAAPVPVASRRKTSGWAWGALVVGVLAAVVAAAVLLVRSGDGSSPTVPQPMPTSSQSLCRDNPGPSTETAPEDVDRVRSGPLSIPRLPSPFGAPKGEFRVPFGVDVQSQEATVEADASGTPTWVASVLIARLLAGDGFYGPEQGATVVADCVAARFYGNAEVNRRDRRSEAIRVDGQPAWLIESDLSFAVPDVRTTGELMIVVVIDTGNGEGGLFYASIPDTSPQFVGPARRSLEQLRVEQ